jgi:hypothetical protein
MLINKDSFTSLVVVYHGDIYFTLVTNLTFKWQLHLEIPFYHISQDLYLTYLLTTIKLKQDFESGSSKDKKCPVFTRALAWH